MNFANWKTTLLGLAAIFTAAGHLLSQFVAGDFNALGVDVPLIVSGVMGLVAKDYNVTGGDTKQS